MRFGRTLTIAWAVAAALAGTSVAPAMAQGTKLVLGLPGVPPIFSTVVAYVAEKEGFFKKYGADVVLRNFDTGTAAARAAAAGDADMSISPTPLVVNQVANDGVTLFAVYSLPNPDFVLGTTDAKKASCADVKGQTVGVDTPGGARSIALKEMLIGCHMTMSEVQEVGLGSNTAPAMIAGQIHYGVLHLDDIPAIEAHGKTVTIVTTLAKAAPTSHYLVGVLRRDRLAQKRDAVVRLVAGLISAGRYMSDPKNADSVAQIATVTGHDAAQAKAALKRFVAMGFWAINDDGLARNKIEAVVATQKKIGNIKPGKTPPTYDALVDQSVWRDANAMVSHGK